MYDATRHAHSIASEPWRMANVLRELRYCDTVAGAALINGI